MTDKEYLNTALAQMHTGQWFGFSSDEQNYSTLILHDSSITKPTEAEVNAKIQELKGTNSTSSNYEQQRRNAYPSIGDQLDMLWHSIDNDAELKSKYFDFHQAILAVKAKHPK